jgi:hypothetical protein
VVRRTGVLADNRLASERLTVTALADFDRHGAAFTYRIRDALRRRVPAESQRLHLRERSERPSWAPVVDEGRGRAVRTHSSKTAKHAALA